MSLALWKSVFLFFFNFTLDQWQVSQGYLQLVQRQYLETMIFLHQKLPLFIQNSY